MLPHIQLDNIQIGKVLVLFLSLAKLATVLDGWNIKSIIIACNDAISLIILLLQDAYLQL